MVHELVLLEHSWAEEVLGILDVGTHQLDFFLFSYEPFLFLLLICQLLEFFLRHLFQLFLKAFVLVRLVLGQAEYA